MSETGTFDAKAYRADRLGAFTTTGEHPLTPDVLLAMAERADSEYRELLKQFPPGTVHDRRNMMHEVSECALMCAEWLEQQDCKAMAFVGPFGPKMPIRGIRVVIRKGARVFGTRPGTPKEGALNTRDRTVTVRDCDRGYVDWSGIRRSGAEYNFRQARVTWAGAGGYWCWTDANNLSLMVQVATPA